jgi:hypothetical protein
VFRHIKERNTVSGGSEDIRTRRACAATLRKRFRFLNAEQFGTFLAVQPFFRSPLEGQEIDCKVQSNSR